MIQRNGLTESEVAESRRLHGTNRLSEKKRRSFWSRYGESFADPIIKILVGALVLNLLVSYKNINWFEIGGIVVAVLFSTLVSTLSEQGSESAFRRMAEMGRGERCRVRRREGVSELPIEELVVGDIVILEAGQRSPADGVLLSGELTVDQSALNGESGEVKKRAGTEKSSREAQTLIDRADAIGRGCLITAGSAEMEITAVGDSTYYGQAAAELQSETRPSPLKHRLATLASNISFVGYVAAGMVAFACLFNSFVLDAGMDWALVRARLTDGRFVLRELLHALTVAVSILVVAVPEGLPMMITVVLSSNTKRMLKDHVIVRKLVGIETAGSLNVLFTDKTGTLTEGRMKGKEWLFGDGKRRTPTELRQTHNINKVLAASMISNNASSFGVAGRAIGGNATDRAVLEFAAPLSRVSLPSVLRKKPFSSEDKYAAAVVSGLASGGSTVLFKGAPEVILPHVGSYLDENGALCPADAPFFGRVTRYQKEASDDACRILAFALKENGVGTELSGGLTFLGLLCIRDRVRREAPAAVAEAHRAGVQVVMVTGDNPVTAGAVARECGILNGKWDGILTGAEMRAMSDEELKGLLPRLAVVARAVPSDKTRLVRLSQELGMVAGMTGDGVNDAPALKCADVGFAMGAGTDVACEAGDIIIADNNFASITRAIRYGRTIFDSIRKFILFQLTMNLTAVSVCLVGPFIGIEEPVTVTQMLWVNLIMDTLGGLAFAGEPPLSDYMRQMPNSRDARLITGEMLRRILVAGAYAVGLCLWFLKSGFVGRALTYSGEAYRMSAFFAMFIFCGIFISFVSRTPRLNLSANLAGNKPFLLIMLLISVVQLLFIYFGGEAFRAVPLLPKDLLTVLLISSTVIPADLLHKLAFRQVNKRRGHGSCGAASRVSTAKISA